MKLAVPISLQLALFSLLAAVILLGAANLDMPWEQDQPAKAAQNHALIASDFHLSDTPNLYRLDKFPLFYLVSSLFQSTAGLGDYKAMNVLAIVCGIIFFPAAVLLSSRFFGANALLAFAALLSCPAIFLTFIYGNEAALALLFLSLSILSSLASNGSLAMALFAGLLAGSAALSRMDYAVFIAVAPLFQLVSTSAPRLKLDARSLRCAVITLVSGFLLFVAFYAILLRSAPAASTFDHKFNLLQTGAYLAYGLGIFLVPAAATGLFVQFKRNWLLGLLLLAVASHALLYTWMFSSTKYVLPLFLVTAIFSAIGLTAIWARHSFAVVVLLIAPWLLSVTPFGVKWGQTGALYFVPTDDGPLPSGAFLSFYRLVNEGFFQQRYLDEEEQVRKTVALLPELGDVTLVGFFNPQTPMLVGAREGDFHLAERFRPNPAQPPESADQRVVMIKTSYLYPRRMSPEVQAWFHEALKSGLVRPLTDEDSPFPDAILISRHGCEVPEAKELIARISHLLAMGNDEQWLERSALLPELSGTAWTKRDGAWTSLKKPTSDAKFYSLKSPMEILVLNPQF
jgi:hypothetical protein